MRMQKSYPQPLKINTFLTLESSAGRAHIPCIILVFSLCVCVCFVIISEQIHNQSHQITFAKPTHFPAGLLSHQGLLCLCSQPLHLCAILSPLFLYQPGPTTLWLLPLQNCHLWCTFHLVVMQHHERTGT